MLITLNEISQHKALTIKIDYNSTKYKYNTHSSTRNSSNKQLSFKIYQVCFAFVRH